MKEGVQSVEITTLVNNIDFIGSINEASTLHDSQVLKGYVSIKLAKAVKIKSITIKFKGTSVVQTLEHQHEISTPLLPKLKTKALQKSTLLVMGDHRIPWELQVPNIYPRSFQNKRSKVEYKVQVKVSLGINKSILASRIVNIRRHLLKSQQEAVLVNSKRVEGISSRRLSYTIQIPKIVCIEQGYMPISIEFKVLDKSLLVKRICAQLVESTVYRCRNISKSEADMASSKKSSVIITQSYESIIKLGDNGLSRTSQRVLPVTISTLDTVDQDYTSIPLMVKHDLSKTLQHSIESPLVSISHQLELTFNFGLADADQVRVKVPVIVTSVPDSKTQLNGKKYVLEDKAHRLPISTEAADTLLALTRPKEQQQQDSKTLKKALSDHNLAKRHTQQQDSVAKQRSITPSFPSATSTTSKRTMKAIDIDLANSSVAARYMYTPTSATFSDEDDGGSPFGTFAGLHPPPRRARKKEPLTNVSDGSRLSRTRTISTSTTYTPITATNAMHATSLNDCLMSLPPITPESPRSPTRMGALLSQSKSMNTSSTSIGILKKRSNSINHILTSEAVYSRSVTNHYVEAELPPIPPPPPPSTTLPPAITRQRLPSIPNVEEHRKTKIYFEEDDSDDDEDDSQFNFLV